MRLLFTSLFFLIIAAINAQPGSGQATLKGVVVNTANSKPLEYCYVVLYKPLDSSMVTGSITDSSGSFSITSIPYGKYFLKVNLIGHKPLMISDIVLSPKIPVQLLDTIKLSPNTGLLEAVEIKDKKQLMEFSLDKKVVNVEKNLVSAGGTAIDVMQAIPSVTVDVDGNLSMRGNSNITVLIDGKPSSLTGVSRSAMLEQIPASSIESIEIISNPSAKYDPDGMTGIINIILKKKKERGYNGVLSFNAGTGSKYTASAGINLSKKFFNVFGNYDYRFNDNTFFGDFDRTQTFGDTLSYYYLNEEGNRSRESNSFKLGTDIYLNKKNTFTLSVLYSLSTSADNENGRSNYANAENIFYDTYQADNFEKGDNKGIDYLFNYKRNMTKKGEYLTFDAVYSKNISDETNELSTQQLLTDQFTELGSPILQNGITSYASYVSTLQADYVSPFGSDRRLECGAKSIIRELDNKYTLKDFNDSTADWVKNSLSNRFIYDEQIHAVYATFADKIGKFEYQAGLRAEKVFTESIQKTTDEIHKKEYLSFFPTLHLNLNLKNDNSLQLSYSRRVNRPAYHMLNPFADVSHTGIRHYGNPYLLPEYIDSYEFGHMKYWSKTSLNSSVFYKQINNAIQRYVSIDSMGIQNVVPMNISTGTSYGLELILSQEFAGWCKLNGTFSYFRTIMKGSEEGEELTNSNYSWTAKLNAMITPIKGMDIQITGNYRAPMVQLQGTFDAMYFADIAIKKDVFKSKASINARLSDIFNTQSFKMHRTGTDFVIDVERRRESRVFYLGFTYKINGGAKGKDKKKVIEGNGFEGMEE